MSQAEDILEGIFCQTCGGYINDEPSGHPRDCRECEREAKGELPTGRGGYGRTEDYRITSTKEALEKMGFVVKPGPGPKSHSVFAYGKKFNFWPYKGYFNGPSTGRGFKNLLEAIKKLEPKGTLNVKRKP